MKKDWIELIDAAKVEVKNSGVTETEELISELRPCWIFHSNVIEWRENGEQRFNEPKLGSSKLGGRPDLPSYLADFSP